MANPSPYPTLPLSTLSTLSPSSRPASTKRSRKQNDRFSNSMILDDCRATDLRAKSNRNGQLSLRTLLTSTILLSTCFAVLTVDISRPANGGSGGIHVHDTQSHLRRGNLEADFGIPSSDSSASPFRSPDVPIRFLQTNLSETNALCDLEYCQTAFDKESLCPPEVEEKGSLASIPIVAQIFLLLILLSFSALFSGLTLGLMSLDLTGLEIVMAGDDPDAAKYAATIYPLRKEGNLLLCTLLLGNVAVNSLMAIFTAAIFNGTVGFIASTMLIVIFGEIIPQALCSRYALRIGSAAVPTVKAIKLLCLIIAWPLAKALDLALGRELATTYSNAEMIELLNVHVKENIIDQEEANAMAGALTYKTLSVKEVMTPMENTFMLEVDERLSFETIGKIFKTGYSRIPVFEITRNNIIGLLFVKDLIFLDPEDCVPVRSFIQIFGRNVHVVWPDDTLGDVLAELKKGKSHLAVVRDVNNDDELQDPFYEVKGIITLEDIVERIIGDSIVDETDAFADSNQRIKLERRETFEWARLRLLDTKIVDEMLSASEIDAVTAHLKTNHSEPFQMLTDGQLTRLISSTPVTTLPTATHELNKVLPNELLYEKGVPSDTFTLILSGKVTIFVGSENFRSDISSWSVLGGKSLADKDWAPDYSAFVSDGPCRFIQIRRDDFVEAADASTFERRVAESSSNAIRQALSTVSSTDANEDAPSTTSDISSTVPNRRKDVLAKLFKNSNDNECVYDEANETTDIDAKKTQEVLLNGAMSIADEKKKEGKEEEATDQEEVIDKTDE